MELTCGAHHSCFDRLEVHREGCPGHRVGRGERRRWHAATVEHPAEEMTEPLPCVQ